MKENKDQLKNKYNGYSADKLIQDDYFIGSMIRPTKESDACWKKLIDEGTISSHDYRLACYMFDCLQVNDETISDNEINRLWDNIRIAGDKLNKQKERKRNFIFLFTLSTVASILLMIAIFAKYNSEKNDTDVGLLIENVTTPTGSPTDIQLILADNQAIAVDGKEADIKYDGQNIEINNKDKTISKRKKQPSETHVYNQLIVPKGKRSTLTLEDGSKVWINAGTRVVYPVVFADEKREIYVDGEVFLEITPEEDRPFTVKSNNLNVEVLGTSFNFMAYDKDATQHLVLVSGKVKIKTDDNRDVVLSPSEMYLIENGTPSIKEVDVDDYTSWKSGMYQYKSESMNIIMKRLSRYYGQEIECRQEIANIKCSGKLDLKDDLGTVLNGISKTAPVKYQINNGKYTIVKK